MTTSANTLANTLSSVTNISGLHDFHETLNTSFNTTLLECTRQFNSFMATMCQKNRTHASSGMTTSSTHYSTCHSL